MQTGQIPHGRSYHASGVYGNNLIVFSGCGSIVKLCRLFANHNVRIRDEEKQRIGTIEEVSKRIRTL